jgi:hypothetical protein
MDPVSLIVTALTAGAVAGAQGAATDAVKDLYSGLKALVRKRFTGRAAGEVALEQHEAKPEQWEKALEAELVEVAAGSDAELVRTAQQLMELVDRSGSQAGKYLVDVRGAQGVQVGDRNQQTNTFGAPPAV